MDVKIYSVNPDSIEVECGIYGNYEIDGAGQGQVSPGTLLRDRSSLKDLGDDKFEKHTDSGESLAKDIITRHPDAGFFLPKGDVPSPAEIRQAHETFGESCRQLVRHADSVWERTHSRELIEEKARRAAKYLKLSPAWLDAGSFESDTKECPRCFETIKAKANLCKHCGTDIEAYSLMKSAEPKAATSLPPVGAGRKL